MKVVFIFLILLSLTCHVYLYDSPQKDKCMRQLKSKLSNYLEDKQLGEIMDEQMSKIITGETPDTITSKFLQDLLDILTPSQYSTIITKGLACSSSLGNITIFDVMNDLGNIIYNNLMAFVTQLCDLNKVYQKKGMTEDACSARIYGKINQFATYKRVETIFCRYRTHYTNKQWAAIYKSFKPMFVYDNYPCCIPGSK